MAEPAFYRLFSWEHSYFSGKIRAYLRYKAHAGALAYEDILATQELVAGLLLPATQTPAVPQVLAPDGTWVQDSSEIIDFCERAHADPPVIPSARTSPRQCLASHLIELLADEWMIVYGFHERWLYGKDDANPSHATWNEQQWGTVFAPNATGIERRRAARTFFELAFDIANADTSPRGVYMGLVDLGVDETTAPAWKASNDRLLAALEAHFDVHDFVLGGLPSLGDFGLLAPLYAHLYRDAVAGFELKTQFPLVAEWVERANGTNALNARTYGQKLYTIGSDGELVPRPATSDGGKWLDDDEVPDSLVPVLGIFFDEMWPVLKSSIEVLRAWLDSDAHQRGDEVPGKSFTATPGFETWQQGEGALTHEFEIGGVRGRRMVVPYQVWMLARLASVVRECTETASGASAIEELLGRVDGGLELLSLDTMLDGCALRKAGGRLYSQS